MNENYQTMATILMLEMGSQFQKGQFLQKWVSMTTLNQFAAQAGLTSLALASASRMLRLQG